MHHPESRLDTARRDAAVVKARVSAQTAIIDALIHCKCDTTQADARLSTLSNALELARLRLGMEEKRALADRQ